MYNENTQSPIRAIDLVQTDLDLCIPSFQFSQLFVSDRRRAFKNAVSALKAVGLQQNRRRAKGVMYKVTYSEIIVFI